MRTSIVAVGWSEDFLVIGFERFGAKAEERSEEILTLSHVAVMESGNSLQVMCQSCVASRIERQYSRRFYYEHVVFFP